MASSVFLSHGRMIRLEASRVFQISRSTSPTHICSDHFASLKRFAVMWWMPALRMGILRRRKGNAPGKFSDEFLPTAFGCASSNLGIPAIKHYIYRSRLASASRKILTTKKENRRGLLSYRQRPSPTRACCSLTESLAVSNFLGSVCGGRLVKHMPRRSASASTDA